MKIFRLFALLLCIVSQPALAESLVKASLISKTDGIEAGKPLQLGVRLQHTEGWHTYYKDPGDAGMATLLKWKLPHGFVAGEISWPPYERMEEAGIVTNAYKGDVVLPVAITTPEGLETGTSQTLEVRADWLVCKDICIPESADLSIALPVVAVAQPSADAPLFIEQTATKHAQGQSSLPFITALLFALLGGLILNLMPCVLPVLSLKALALVKKAGSEMRSARKQGIYYTLGVLFSFALVAGVLIGLQQAGQAVGWGYQMQSPVFVAFLIFLLFLVGLNLSGLFELPVLLGGVRMGSNTSARGSFYTGVLATAVATPCTAPFMASAVGVALTLPPVQAMAIFLALGFGLALPFLLISFCPPLLRLIPKPGEWMERFRHVLAFAMYGTLIWLLWVITLQTGSGGMVIVLSAMLAILAVLLLRKRRSALTFWLVLIFALCGMVAVDRVMPSVQAKAEMIEGVHTEEFSLARIEQLRAEGKTVFVDATAAWCITCQVNKRTAILVPSVMDAFKAKGTVLMVADWTLRNEEITKFLAEFGYNGVPLYVVYPADGGKPKVLPQILTPQIVIEAIS